MSTYEILLILINCVLIMCGLAGNVLVCLSVATCSELKTIVNILLVNLAIADVLVLLFCAPFSILQVTDSFSYSIRLEILHWQPNYLFRTSQTHGFLEHYFVRLLYSFRWAVKKLKCLKKEAFFSRDGLQQWHSFICRLWVCLSQSSHWQPLPITDTKVCQFGNLKSWKLLLNSPLLL